VGEISLKKVIAMMEGAQASQWWNIKRAALYLDMSVAFLRKGVRQKRIPFVRAGSKALRFRKEDLDAWLESNGCNGEQVHSNQKGR
jgi:excisionase family DNA binding protein